MMYFNKILAFISLFCFFNITNAQTQFTKYAGNPVLKTGSSGAWDSKQVSHPRLLFDGKLYRMWYAGSNDTCRQIGYATSTDGVNWTKHIDNPILKIGQRGAIDDLIVSPGAVVYDGSRYLMYYTARSIANAGTICRATSPDGITWTKDDANNPVLKRGDPGWWDDYGLSAGPVLKQSTKWKMWYNGFRSDTRWYTGLAVSSDGVHWTKDTLNNPLLEFGAPGTWDEYEQWIADILPDSSYYEAFYFGNTKQRAIGYAVSRDGIAWGKYEGNPILTPEHSTDDKAFLFQSCVLKNREEYKIWYSDGTTAQICFALSAAFTPASAQEKADKMLAANKPVAGAAKGESKQAKMKVTYENGIKIVGEKTFDIDIRGDSLYILNVKFADGRVVSAGKDKKEILAKMGLKNATSKDIKEIIYTTEFETSLKKAYIIFETGIMEAVDRLEDLKNIFGHHIVADDRSKIFTHENAIFLAKDGSIVATTPTTLLVITPNYKLSVTYESLFGAIPPFKKPTISEGRTLGEVFIRDETMRNETNAVRLELDMKTLEITVAKDILALLGSK